MLDIQVFTCWDTALRSITAEHAGGCMAVAKGLPTDGKGALKRVWRKKFFYGSGLQDFFGAGDELPGKVFHDR
jgi:hypothetical protein